MKKASSGSRNPGRSQARGNAVDRGEFEESEEQDVSEESEEEVDRKPSSRVTKRKGVGDREDDEAAERGNGNKKHTSQRPLKRSHFSSYDEEGSDDEEEQKRSRKKNVVAVRTKQRQNVKDEDSEGEEQEAMRGPRPRIKKDTGNDDDSVCQLSKNRFVAVQNFNGKLLVSIREYYESAGKRLPSKKGISLTLDQWQAFKEGIPDIEAAIRQLK